MAAYRLSGPELIRLRDLLLAAFSTPDRFEEFLLERLDRKMHNFVSVNDSYKTAVRKVLEEANAALWWRDLLAAARNANPGDPDLLAFGTTFGVSPVAVTPADANVVRLDGNALELKIKAAQSTFDIGTWRRRLGEVEGQVCRVEVPGELGTGFLVGPDVVLTNFHVIQKVFEGPVKPASVRIRFDYKVADDDVSVQAGTVYQLAEDWLADHSRYSPMDELVDPTADPHPDELDYALLRIEGRPGEDPVGGPTEDVGVPRKWIALPSSDYDFPAHSALYIVQHPEGKPMQVAVDSDAIIGLNSNRTRVRYTTTTECGSSGSPCFGPDWQCVALHHSGDPKFWDGAKPEFNRGIPLSAIRDLLAHRGKSGLLGPAS